MMRNLQEVFDIAKREINNGYNVSILDHQIILLRKLNHKYII